MSIGRGKKSSNEKAMGIKHRCRIRLVSCDLNGTLVHQHTMMDMLRVYFPETLHRYETAKEAFAKQITGLMSMREAFEIAGPLTKGLSLRNAIEYVRCKLRFLEGFEDFTRTLHDEGRYLVINSTGYSVTTEAIKALYGHEKFYETICNRLIFGWGGQADKGLDEIALAKLVHDYFLGKGGERTYDDIRTTGDVELRISDEAEKPKLLNVIATRLNIPSTEIAHVGDSMGDSEAIYKVARNGGLGIAFNYNEALKSYLEWVMKNERLQGTIVLVQPKSERASLQSLLPLFLSD